MLSAARVFGDLQASPLEVLHPVGLVIGYLVFVKRLAYRVAQVSDVPVRLPVRQERLAQVVMRLRHVRGRWGWAGSIEVVVLLCVVEKPEIEPGVIYRIARAVRLRIEFERSVAKILHGATCFVQLIGNSGSEPLQAAFIAPEAQEIPSHAMSGVAEA